jgi:hypothetical protein
MFIFKMTSAFWYSCLHDPGNVLIGHAGPTCDEKSKIPAGKGGRFLMSIDVIYRQYQWISKIDSNRSKNVRNDAVSSKDALELER